MVTRLARLGHEVIVSASWGISGGGGEIDGILHLPGALNSSDVGGAALRMHVEALRPDVTITLLDVWTGKKDKPAGRRRMGRC